MKGNLKKIFAFCALVCLLLGFNTNTTCAKETEIKKNVKNSVQNTDKVTKDDALESNGKKSSLGTSRHNDEDTNGIEVEQIKSTDSKSKANLIDKQETKQSSNSNSGDKSTLYANSNKKSGLNTDITKSTSNNASKTNTDNKSVQKVNVSKNDAEKQRKESVEPTADSTSEQNENSEGEFSFIKSNQSKAGIFTDGKILLYGGIFLISVSILGFVITFRPRKKKEN